MNGTSGVLYFILYLGTVFCDFLSSGQEMTFKPEIKDEPESILWKHDNNKVVEYENKNIEWYRFKKQASLNIKTGALTLTTLNKNNSGLYEYEIQVNGQLKHNIFEITVIDPLSPPKVACNVDTPEPDKLTLSCSVDSFVSARLSWSGPNDFTSESDRIVINKHGSSTDTYICTAANEVSSKSTEFQRKDCHKDSHLGLIIGITITVVCGVICGVVGFKLHRDKKRACITSLKPKDDVTHEGDNQEGVPLDASAPST